MESEIWIVTIPSLDYKPWQRKSDITIVCHVVQEASDTVEQTPPPADKVGEAVPQGDNKRKAEDMEGVTSPRSAQKRIHMRNGSVSWKNVLID